MSFWRQLKRGLRALTNRTAADEDVADEVRHYFEQATQDLVASGLSRGDASRAARLQLGDMTAVRDQVRAYGWENWIATLVADLRYATRQLRRNPAFAVMSVLSLALGIGASTAIFSAVNPILFEPLPYPHAARIMMIWDIFQGARSDVTFHTYREVLERNRSFEAVAVMEPWQPTMTGQAEPERFDGQRVSASFFRVLGVEPVTGRDLQASDEAFLGPKVALLSYGLWHRRFAGDQTIVGRRIMLDGDSYTVVGVMPHGFENVLAPSAEIWTPLQYDPGHVSDFDTGEWGHHLRMAGRLRADVGISRAAQELNGIARIQIPEFPRPPWASLKNGFIVNSLQDEVTRAVRPALLAVFGAVMLVLAIASVNVTNLLLARGAQRRGECAMRTALGAGRSRLIRQLLTESLLLSVLSGVVGMFVAEIGVRALVALSPPGLPRVGAIAVHGTALAFALGLTTLVGLAIGLIPALQASGDELQMSVQQSSGRTAGSRQLTRRALVVAEIALALVLLLSAGLLLHSLERLFSVAPGFEPSQLLTMQVQTSGHQFDDAALEPGSGHGIRHRFFAQALENVRKVPGIAAAAFTSLLPLSGDQFGVYGTRFEDGHGYDVYRYVATPGYFETMGIPLRRGRLLEEHDSAGAPQAVVISESLAQREFAGKDPIGRRVHIGPLNRPWYTIVGVVGDVKQASLAASEPDAVYITPTQSWFADEAMSLVVRSRGDMASLIPEIKHAIWSVDRDQPIIRAATMDYLLAATAAQRRFALIIFQVFGIVALVLAATGIYGVLSFSVAERTHEIAIRSALGATRTSVLALVVRQGMMLVGFGTGIGLTGATLATQALLTLLFGISRLDPMTHLIVILLLLGVSMIACCVPAWRASRIDSSVALRTD